MTSWRCGMMNDNMDECQHFLLQKKEANIHEPLKRHSIPHLISSLISSRIDKWIIHENERWIFFLCSWRFMREYELPKQQWECIINYRLKWGRIQLQRKYVRVGGKAKNQLIIDLELTIWNPIMCSSYGKIDGA